MPQSNFPMIVAKNLTTADSRRKYKRQCLKQKNILQQTGQIQIGCKIQKLYDFYSSRNYVQINLFIGNKTKDAIKGYQIGFRGTENLSVYLEDKKERVVKENTQAKERIIIEWLGQSINSNGEESDYSHGIFLTMSFSSPLLTLKDTPIPLSVWSFCHFPPQPLPYPQINPTQLLNKGRQSYELVEQQQFQLNQALFKKGQLVKQLQKYFDRLIKINGQSNNNVFAGVFTIKSLLEEHLMILELNQNNQKPIMKITLAGNQYKYFQSIFAGMKFLLEK